MRRNRENQLPLAPVWPSLQLGQELDRAPQADNELPPVAEVSGARSLARLATKSLKHQEFVVIWRPSG